MGLRRPEDKNVFKYWLPYGLMRRHLARAYGIVVRGGLLVKQNPGQLDNSGFNWKDFFPLGMVMLLQRCQGGGQNVITNSELKCLKSRISQLEKRMDEAQMRDEERVTALEVENLKLRLFARDIIQANKSSL